uniref:helix-turn-helix domain-containing protein n=1 Tax=Pseudomonas sp. TH41 TaxID=2796405 RepID=UPI001F5B5852|nr:nuclear transport factor 2 family protein [Pseudomonas sp. TH41]
MADASSVHTHDAAVRYHEAWKRRDLDGVMALYHPMIEYHDFFQNRRLAHAQLRDYLRASMPLGAAEFQTYTDRLRVDGDTAFLQYRVTLNGSDGLVSFQAIEALTVKDGLIVNVNEHAVLVSHMPTGPRPPYSREAVSRLGLSARQVGALSNDLQQYFEQSKPYLDPTLDLSQVAALTGYSRNQISFFLNQVRGQTFYSFLNQLRLEEALVHLTAQCHASRIDEIARASGFNSLSTFYRCFKQKTGYSPKSWLQKREPADAKKPAQGGLRKSSRWPVLVSGLQGLSGLPQNSFFEPLHAALLHTA